MMRRRYGASRRHLLAHVATLAAIAYALVQAFQPRFAPKPFNLALWLIAGALLHDLVLLPAYSAVDAGLRRVPGRAANFVRVPAMLSGITLLVYAPRILDRQPQNTVRSLGHPPADYLGRWLALTAALFALSGLAYAVRAARAARRRPARP
jgi:hypothetical protein